MFAHIPQCKITEIFDGKKISTDLYVNKNQRHNILYIIHPPIFNLT